MISEPVTLGEDYFRRAVLQDDCYYQTGTGTG